MATGRFDVREHIIDGQHIRDNPGGLNTDEDVTLKLAVKEYVPKVPVSFSRFPPMTIIGGHANGIPKEVYEPLWDDLLGAVRAQGGDIRSVWVADNAHQGDSAVVNEHVLGDDPSWFDHARDLMAMINHFRKEMIRPIIGIGHSLAGCQMAFLSLMHPRLLAGLVLMEPVIMSDPPAGPNTALMATLRKDVWDTMAEAEMSLRSVRALSRWDERIMDKYIAHSFRKTPTLLYPEPGKVTLKTTKHQESWTFMRTNFEPPGDALKDQWIEPALYQEPAMGRYVFTRAECQLILNTLPNLRPPVFYVFGSKSPMSTSALISQKMVNTGVGMGGSGGEKAGRVEKMVVKGGTHFCIFDQPTATMDRTGAWLLRVVMPAYVEREKFLAAYKANRSKKGMLEVSDVWKDLVKKPSGLLRSRLPRQSKL